MRVHSFHSHLALFYHDNDDCPFGQTIKPLSRRPGKAGLGLCMLCRKLDKEDEDANSSMVHEAQLED
ncbi:MAG: hypothetical protein ABF780_03845 [Bifidobacterium aquikefiri]|uniref:hypothetical protein n=1 Tax=Bifidobacterium aquikefiri TaxID=1653207 RepID=UPI000B9A56B4|nr:hypothetical protein [Bifidobacterium aquikefiri]